MVLAHVTKTLRFPTGGAIWHWSALDTNWPLLTGRAPLVQHSAHNVGVVVGLTLALSALGLTTWDVPAYASALTASVFLLGLVVFTRKQLIAEVRKLFSA